MRTALALAAVLVASPALAEEPPVATAAPEAPLSVADQIDAYLKSSPVLEVESPGGVDGIVPRGLGRDDRKVYGEVSVGIGTGGYRSVYARTDVPLGETGRLSLAFEDTRYGRGHAPGRFQGYGAGLGFGADRQRCDLEGLSPPRALDVAGGPNGRCVRRFDQP